MVCTFRSEVNIDVALLVVLQLLLIAAIYFAVNLEAIGYRFYLKFCHMSFVPFQVDEFCLVQTFFLSFYCRFFVNYAIHCEPIEQVSY